MDEVMADTLSEHVRRYNQNFDHDVTPADLLGKGLWQITPFDREGRLRAFRDARPSAYSEGTQRVSTPE
jgi:5'-nucleotidase